MLVTGSSVSRPGLYNVTSPFHGQRTKIIAFIVKKMSYMAFIGLLLLSAVFMTWKNPKNI